MSVVFIITHPEGMVQQILTRCMMLEIGLESEQEFSRLMVEVAEGRSDINDLIGYLAGPQTTLAAKDLAAEICMEFVAKMMAEISCVRSNSGLYRGSFYFDQWTAQGDLRLAHHA